MASSKIDHSPRFTGLSVTGVILRLALTWWAEAAQILVNGVAVQEGDLRLLNQSAAQPICDVRGRNIVTFAAGKSSHDDALVRSMRI